MRPLTLPAAVATAALLLPVLPAVPTRAAEPTPPAPEALLGTWTVDLRPTPDAPAYLKKLVVTSVAGGKLEGNFYDGSPLQSGRLNVKSSPTVCFAFCTDPGEGAYFTSGRLVGPDQLEGMTLSTSRGFLLPWHAVRETAAAAAGSR